MRMFFITCFVGGIEILTPEGEKDIEDIKVGEWVIGDDSTTPGEIQKQRYLQAFVRDTPGKLFSIPGLYP